jgi:RiboL-PSP-HEPN
MGPSRALASFREIRPEIADLFRTSRRQPDEAPPDRRMSSQENHLRHVVVALIGALQSYITEMLEERADELCESWDSLGPVQKRYVSVQARRRLSHLMEVVAESSLAENKKIEQLQACVYDCAGWYETPSLLARSAYREKLEGFLADNGTKAIDRAVSQFGNCGLSFFSWLSRNYPRYRGIDDLLDSAIALRNDVAHGTFNRRVTLRELRVYRVAIYRMIGRIDEYESAV